MSAADGTSHSMNLAASVASGSIPPSQEFCKRTFQARVSRLGEHPGGPARRGVSSR